MPKSNRNREIERRLSIMETLMQDTRDDIKNIRENHLTKIWLKLEEIDKKIYQRPSWTVAGLLSITTALIVYLLTH